jgi:hypothetical protein
MVQCHRKALYEVTNGSNWRRRDVRWAGRRIGGKALSPLFSGQTDRARRHDNHGRNTCNLFFSVVHEYSTHVTSGSKPK